MTELADSFFKWLKFEKRASAHTLIAYQGDLSQLGQFLEKESPGLKLEQVSSQHLRFFLLELGRLGLEPATLSRKVASIKAFYKFLVIRKYREDNPAARLKGPRKKIRNPDFIEASALNKALNTALSEKDWQFESLRNALVVELFYGTGIRLSELIGLQIQDLDLNHLQIKVLGKRAKVRWVPIHKPLANLFKHYLLFRNEIMGQDATGFVFITEKGQAVYPVLVRKVVKAALAHTTTQNKKSPHTLRHSFATHLLDKGAEINAIKELLGHSSLAATQVYTHNTIEKLKRAYYQAHPRAGEEAKEKD